MSKDALLMAAAVWVVIQAVFWLVGLPTVAIAFEGAMFAGVLACAWLVGRRATRQG